jgi:prokaryotic ubiquitin-like protein Pup
VTGQVHKAKPQHPEAVEAPEPQKAKSGEELKAELDAVLDDIDSALEENAEEFVRNYVQKGGQ